MIDLIFKFLLAIATGLLHIVYPYKIVGKENLPEGGCLLCGNHTHFSDPLFIVMTVGKDRQYAAMGKAELFKNKVFAAFFRFVGVFPVTRGKNDLGAIRTALEVLKKGKKLILFPEGTRVKPGMTVKPKTGAVRISQKTKKPIVPIYIPAKKRMFTLWDPIEVVIGQPYVPVIEDPNDYEQLTAAAAQLMDNIQALGGEKA